MIQMPFTDNAWLTARKEIAARFVKLGITDEREMVSFIARNANARPCRRPTLQDLLDLLQIMEGQLETGSNT